MLSSTDSKHAEKKSRNTQRKTVRFCLLRFGMLPILKMRYKGERGIIRLIPEFDTFAWFSFLCQMYTACIYYNERNIVFDSMIY